MKTATAFLAAMLLLIARQPAEAQRPGDKAVAAAIAPEQADKSWSAKALPKH